VSGRPSKAEKASGFPSGQLPSKVRKCWKGGGQKFELARDSTRLLGSDDLISLTPHDSGLKRDSIKPSVSSVH
jgi:hypothetical protein